MGFPAELWETLRKLSALEARTEDVMRAMDRIEGKVGNLIDRIARVETRYESLRENVRNDILAEIKADLSRTQVLLEIQRAGRTALESSDAPAVAPPG